MKKVRLKDGRDLLIREVRLTDAANLLELLQHVHRETGYLLRTPDEFKLTLEQEKAFIRDRLQDSCYLALVGEVEGKVVTSMGVQRGSQSKLSHTASFGISVSKEYWGLGIGRAMIEAMFAWAKENGVEKINLEVFEENIRAQKLYLDLGFGLEGRKRKQIKMDDKYQDLLLMGKFV